MTIAILVAGGIVGLTVIAVICGCILSSRASYVEERLAAGETEGVE